MFFAHLNRAARTVGVGVIGAGLGVAYARFEATCEQVTRASNQAVDTGIAMRSPQHDSLKRCMSSAVTGNGGKPLSANHHVAQQLRHDAQRDFVSFMQMNFCLGFSRAQGLDLARSFLMARYENAYKRSALSGERLRLDINAWADQFPTFEVSPKGSKLPKIPQGFQLRGDRLGRHTIIRDSEGRCHTLLSVVYPDEAGALQRAGHGIGIGKITLGWGASGVVRLARGEPCGYHAVKKIVHHPDDQSVGREIEILKKIKHGEHLVRYCGSAQVARADDQVTTYIFMDLAGLMDGEDAALCRQVRAVAEHFDLTQYVHHIGKQYIQAVAELHAQSIYHCDLKLENFAHDIKHDAHNDIWGDDERVKLVDFGGALDDEFSVPDTVTRGFIPPERRAHFLPGFKEPHACDAAPVSNIKHDAWALGMVLLRWRLGGEIPSGSQISLSVTDKATGHAVRLPLNFHRRECMGLHHTDRYVGDTWDEVIAKLLDVDPKKRPTPAQVLRFPLFQRPSDGSN